MASENSSYQICPLCEACCGLEIRVVGAQVQSIRGLSSDVLSKGFMCPKGVALKDLHEDADRLRVPLIRRNGVLVESTWTEAFEEIERRLLPIQRRFGRQSIGLVLGNPSGHKPALMLYIPQLIKALGTRNVFSAMSLDSMPKHLSSGMMFGHWLTLAVPDIERSSLLIVLGANPAVSNGSLWTVPDFRGKAKALRARGGRIVVIDPRRTETAQFADEHHFIRPGTDVFLLASMVHVLFDENLVKLRHVEGNVTGLAELNSVTRRFSPRVASRICGVPVEVIKALARALAGSDRGCIYGRMGISTQRHGSLCNWLVDCLNTLTGNLDRPGGAMFPRAAAFSANTRGAAGTGRGIVVNRYQSRVSHVPECFGELPMTLLAEEIETGGPDQLRALITIAGNPVLSVPNGRKLERALTGLEFMVSVDLYLNETTSHADVILPGVSPLESSHFDVLFPQFSGRNHARYSPAVFETLEQRPSEWEILLRLSAIVRNLGVESDLRRLDDEVAAAALSRLSVEVLASQDSGGLVGPERLFDLELRHGPYGANASNRTDGEPLSVSVLAATPGGVDLGPLTPRIPEALRTPSGLIELAPAECRQALDAVSVDLPETSAGLQIIGRRDVRSNNSWMHNLKTLAKGPARFTLLVHPVDASILGLTEGGSAVVTRGDSKLTAPVQISDSVMQGVVCLPHGWGHDSPGSRLKIASERPGASLNDLSDGSTGDSLTGTACLSGYRVHIAPFN